MMGRYLWVLTDVHIFHLMNFVTNLLVPPIISDYVVSKSKFHEKFISFVSYQGSVLHGLRMIE